MIQNGEHEAFVVRVGLSSPIIPGRRLTLDGLLAAILHERCGDIDRAHSEIPLAQHYGVWAGSAALLEGPAPCETVQVIGALRAETEMSPEIVAPNGKRGYPRFDVKRDDYKNSMSEYQAFATPAIWFTGTGDVEAVAGLLMDAPFIGTKRSSGYGQVASVDVVPAPGDALAGIRFSDGTPARAIPMSLWGRFSNHNPARAYERVRPPYWKGDYVECAIPRHRIVPFRDLRVLTMGTA